MQQQLQRLQLLEQSIQQLMQQKQFIQSQFIEVESALEELGEQPAYQIIGNIMVKKDANKIKAELTEKKESLHARITSLEKQEEQLRNSMQDIQQEVLEAHNGPGQSD